MNPFSATLLSAISLFTTTAFAQNKPTVQTYATLSIDGWSLFDGGVGSGERTFALLDLGAVFQFTEHLEGHVGGFVFTGDRDVESFTGDFGVYSNNLTESRYILFTTWLQHTFDDSYIRFGQLASDENFYVSEVGSLFLNSNFGAIPTVSANVAAPIFSVGSAGIEYKKQLDNGYFQFGVYAGDPGPGDRDDHGFNWNSGGDDGYFIVAEKAWNFTSSVKQGGQFKIGTYHHSGQFESFSEPSAGRGNSAFYAIVEQPISESARLFARAGFNPKSEYSVIERYFDTGFNWAGVFESRPNDIFGIAYSKSQFSNKFRQSIEQSEGRAIESEHVFEITYAAEIAKGWLAQPNIQYIVNPFYALDNAILGGIRLTIGF